MRARVYEFWELARSSFWFLPSVMMLVGLVLFAITLTIDELHRTGGVRRMLFYSGFTSCSMRPSCRPATTAGPA